MSVYISLHCICSGLVDKISCERHVYFIIQICDKLMETKLFRVGRLLFIYLFYGMVWFSCPIQEKHHCKLQNDSDCATISILVEVVPF